MRNHLYPFYQLFSLKLVKRVVFALVIIFIFDFFLFPIPSIASEESDDITLNANALIAEPVFNSSLPDNSDVAVKYTGVYQITAYSSDVSQCDGAPCITATGFNLCEYGVEDSVALNFLPFGTKIRLPELFGGRVFTVRDRMNSRYDNYVDIWMKNKIDAKKFGVKTAKVEILE